jgi:hypothetical protein
MLEKSKTLNLLRASWILLEAQDDICRPFSPFLHSGSTQAYGMNDVLCRIRIGNFVMCRTDTGIDSTVIAQGKADHKAFGPDRVDAADDVFIIPIHTKFA